MIYKRQHKHATIITTKPFKDIMVKYINQAEKGRVATGQGLTVIYFL